MIQRTKIPFPLGGVSDLLAAQDQQLFTTASAKNMRSLDPKSGRKRGAQRSGTSKFVAASAGSSFVQDIITINKDVRLATYTARTSSPLLEWERQAPDETFVRDMVVTPGGDIWVISGKDLIVKYNASGTKILEEKVPLRSDSEEARSLALGSDGALFVSTQTTDIGTSGISRYSGCVIRYESDPLDENLLVLIWTYDAGGRVPSIVYESNSLFIVINKFESAEIVALGELTSDSPIVRWTQATPYPTSHITVNKDGELFVSAAPRVGRDTVVLGSFCGTKTAIDDGSFWTPEDLGIGELRSWQDANDLADFTDNQVVDFWFDKSGNSRNIWAAPAGSGPVEGSQATYGGRYVADAICGMPGIRFDLNANSDGLYPGFTSGVGGNSLLKPDNSPYFICMIFKSRDQGNDASPESIAGKLIERGGQPYHAIRQSATGKFFYGEITDPVPEDNTGAGGINEPIDGTNGTIGATTDPVPNGRVGGMSIDNVGDICILTLAYDPNSDASSATSPKSLEGSFFRVNGATAGIYTDQFTLRGFSSADATRIGYTVWGNQRANMDLCEIIVVDQDFDWPSDWTDAGSIVGTYWPGAPGGSDDGMTAPTSPHPVSDIERVEGYLAHRYGVQAILDSGHPFATTAPTGTGGTAPPATNAYVEVLKSPDGIIAKHANAGGGLIWAVSGSGLGHASVTDIDDDGVYCVGPDNGVDITQLRKVVDQGFTPSELIADGAWKSNPGVGGGIYISVPGTRMAVDSEKNLYVPFQYSNGDNVGGLHKYKLDGTPDVAYTAPEYSMCCAIDTIETDFGDATIGEPEFIYLGSQFETLTKNTKKTVHKLRLVDVVTAEGAPRENEHLVVCAGDIKKIDRGAGTITTISTGGAGALSSTSRIVSSAISGGKVYFIDGERYKVYDPDTGAVTDWASDGSGALPKRAKIIVEWRTRMLLARVEGEPQNIYMSELGKPEGWNLFPRPLVSTSALALAASDAGPVPGTVNALIPYSDDILIIGGDRSIHMLQGDPLAGQLDPARGTFASGQIVLISDSVGMAFGRSWCKDESGFVYFFGSRGGIYRMVPGTPPQKISSMIDRRVKDIDLSKYTVRLVWDERERGMHLYIVPLVTLTATVEHWFWFAEDGSWWPDAFPAATVDPTAVTVADGDEVDDRVILLGCKDGYVRFLDKDSKNDDGVAIDANVLIGPLNPKSLHDEMRFSSFQVALASDQDGADAILYRSDTPDAIGSSVATRTLVAGQNPTWRKRVRGKVVFVELKNNVLNERFAVESIGVDVTPSGRVRK